MKRTGIRRCGAIAQADGSIHWRVWAPKANQVDLVLIDGERRRICPMEKEERGHFQHDEANVSEGQRYAYRLDGGPERPDPCSLWQPEGVHGPSAVVRPERFAWTDRNWKGVPREELVFYELHVGTFTPEGTFEAVIPRLTACATWASRRWSYAGRRSFPARATGATTACFPTPRRTATAGRTALQKLVDACHAARPGDLPRCRLQPLRSRRQLPARSSGRISPTITRPLGHGRQLRRAGLRLRCATTFSTTCGCGWRSFTSMACGWMRSTPSTTSAPATSCGP